MADTIMVRTRLITQLIAGIHNERVVETFGSEALSSENGLKEKRQAILDNFKISIIEDPYALIVLKILGYYLVFDKASQFVAPYMFPEKRDSIKPQLAIAYRPLNRKKWFDKKGKVRYTPNAELHVPHFDQKYLSEVPKLVSFTVGNCGCKYTLKDGTYILVFGKTEAEAIRAVTNLAELTDKNKRPDGTITDNLIITRRPKAKITLLDNLTVKPYQICYFRGGEQTPFYIQQL